MKGEDSITSSPEEINENISENMQPQKVETSAVKNIRVFSLPDVVGQKTEYKVMTPILRSLLYISFIIWAPYIVKLFFRVSFKQFQESYISSSSSQLEGNSNNVEQCLHKNLSQIKQMGDKYVNSANEVGKFISQEDEERNVETKLDEPTRKNISPIIRNEGATKTNDVQFKADEDRQINDKKELKVEQINNMRTKNSSSSANLISPRKLSVNKEYSTKVQHDDKYNQEQHITGCNQEAIDELQKCDRKKLLNSLIDQQETFSQTVFRSNTPIIESDKDNNASLDDRILQRVSTVVKPNEKDGQKKQETNKGPKPNSVVSCEIVDAMIELVSLA